MILAFLKIFLEMWFTDSTLTLSFTNFTRYFHNSWIFLYSWPFLHVAWFNRIINYTWKRSLRLSYNNSISSYTVPSFSLSTFRDLALFIFWQNSFRNWKCSFSYYSQICLCVSNMYLPVLEYFPIAKLVVHTILLFFKINSHN